MYLASGEWIGPIHSDAEKIKEQGRLQEISHNYVWQYQAFLFKITKVIMIKDIKVHHVIQVSRNIHPQYVNCLTVVLQIMYSAIPTGEGNL